MSDKKHIDRLFQERFKDFEAAPSDAVWKNIEANLNKKEEKKRVIPIWWRYAGVAALLLLLLTVGGLFNNTKEAPTKVVDNNQQLDVNISEEAKEKDSLKTTIVNVNEEDPKVINNTQKATTKLGNTKFSKSNENSVIASNTSNSLKKKNNNSAVVLKTNTTIKNTTVANNISNEKEALVSGNSKKNIATLNTPEVNKKEVASVSKHHNKAIAVLKKEQTNTKVAENKEEETLTIEDAIEKNETLLEETLSKQKKWSLAANAAPVYFNSLGKGSSLGQQFVNNASGGELNMSYGLAATYALNNKIKIRSGINRVNLGYNTNNAIELRTAGVALKTDAFSSLNGISVDTNNDNVTSNGNVSVVSATNNNNIPESFSSTNTTLNQDLGFIEIPLEIQYTLLDRKFGVNIIGGFSSFFLNNNGIYSESDLGTRTFLGEDPNLNKVSYSANFGLGFNYKFTEKIDLNLEPMFKYQINTFNNTSGNFTPFILGVYTGFAIKF